MKKQSNEANFYHPDYSQWGYAAKGKLTFFKMVSDHFDLLTAGVWAVSMFVIAFWAAKQFASF